MAWTKTGQLASGRALAPPGWARLFMAGHSWMAGGGASEGEKSWGNILAAMMRAHLANIAVGGAVLAYSERAPGNGQKNGGWAWLVNRLYKERPEANWVGLWTNATAYNLLDGVLYNGVNYIWGGQAATVTGVSAPVPGAGNNGWMPLAGPTSVGASKYVPPGDLIVPFYGGNDLGFHNNLDVFREALTYALTVCSAAWLYDDNWGMIEYLGTWAARGGEARGTSWGQGFRTLPNTNGTQFRVNVPADFPGGTVALLFVMSRGAVFRITSTVDGAAGPTKNVGAANGGLVVPALLGAQTATGNTAEAATNMPGVMRFEGLAPGAHTILCTLDNTAGAIINAYLDGVAIVNDNDPATVLLPSLFYVNDYSIWNTTYGWGVNDAAVDTWNADIIANVLPHFPNVQYVDIANVMNHDPANFSYDSVHPNNKGHELIARTIFDALAAKTRTSADAARTNVEPLSYAQNYWPAAGDTIIPQWDAGDVHIVHLPTSGNVTINAPVGSHVQGAQIRFVLSQSGTGAATVTWGTGWTFTNGVPFITMGAWATTIVDFINFGQGYDLTIANWIHQPPGPPSTVVEVTSAPATAAVQTLTGTTITMLTALANLQVPVINGQRYKVTVSVPCYGTALGFMEVHLRKSGSATAPTTATTIVAVNNGYIYSSASNPTALQITYEWVSTFTGTDALGVSAQNITAGTAAVEAAASAPMQMIVERA